MGKRHVRNLVIALALIAGLSVAAAKPPSLPADVIAFAQKRDICDHFRGEEGEDAARREEITAALESNCRGTDLQLRSLRQIYRKRLPVLKFLEKYEYPVE